MKNPAPGIIIMVNDHFIYYVKIAYGKMLKPTEHFIVVAGNVIDFYTTAKHAGNLFDNLHVTSRPVFFAELPDVDNVAI